MTTNLRLSLTILTLGFGIEGASELVSLASHGTFRPGVNVLFVLPVALTLAGLLFVWVGQHEWNELHRSRIRQAHLIFGLSLLGGVVAGAVLSLLVVEPSWGTPLWARIVFGAAVGSLVLGTFVTYAVLVFHLVARPSKAALLAAIGWALAVSALVGAALASNLTALAALATRRSLSLPSFFGPVDSLASYLFVSYFLLLAVYLDAHRAVLKGVTSAGSPPPSVGGESGTPPT